MEMVHLLYIVLIRRVVFACTPTGARVRGMLWSDTVSKAFLRSKVVML